MEKIVIEPSLQQLDNGLKISHLLAERNPFKKFMCDLENKTKHGWIYKSFCILCLCYGIGTQIYTFICDNRYGLAMLPLTVSICVYTYLNYNSVFFYKQNYIGENNLEKKIKNTYLQLFFILYFSILLGVLVTNYITFSSNHFWYIKFTFRNSFLVYSIVVSVLIHLTFLFNNIFVFYVYNQQIFDRQGEEKRIFIIGNFLSPIFCTAIVWGIYDTFLIKKYNIFFQTLCLVLEGIIIYTIFRILSIFTLYIFRKFSLYLNRFYQ